MESHHAPAHFFARRAVHGRVILAPPAPNSFYIQHTTLYFHVLYPILAPRRHHAPRMEAQLDVTELLHAYGRGDREAFDRLVAVLYDELRHMAHARLTGEHTGHTLNTTALVHEAYLKMAGLNRIQWQDRAHFLAVASRTMRRILVDYALRCKAQKRGGDTHRTAFDEAWLMPETYAETVLELDDALTRLEALHARPGQALVYRYFGGLTNEETAAALNVSVATVERDMRFARAWLSREWSGASIPSSL